MAVQEILPRWWNRDFECDERLALEVPAKEVSRVLSLFSSLNVNEKWRHVKAARRAQRDGFVEILLFTHDPQDDLEGLALKLQTILSLPEPPLLKVAKVPRYPPRSPGEAKEISEKCWPISFRRNLLLWHPEPCPSRDSKYILEGGKDLWRSYLTIPAADGTGLTSPPFACAAYCKFRKRKQWVAEGVSGSGPSLHAVAAALTDLASQLLVVNKRIHRESEEASSSESTRAGSDCSASSAESQSFASESESSSARCGRRNSWETSKEDVGHASNSDCLSADQYYATGLDGYLSGEPCLMCSMSLIHARVNRLFIVNGADNPRAGGLGGLGDPFALQFLRGLNHHYRVYRVDTLKDANVIGASDGPGAVD